MHSYKKKRRRGSALAAAGPSPATMGFVLTAVSSGSGHGLFKKDRAIPLGRITGVKPLNGPFISAKTQSFQKLRRKKEPHIGIPAGFSGSRLGKSGS